MGIVRGRTQTTLTNHIAHHIRFASYVQGKDYNYWISQVKEIEKKRRSRNKNNSDDSHIFFFNFTLRPQRQPEREGSALNGSTTMVSTLGFQSSREKANETQ